ncbi:tyrosine-type recombinase/integrase [Pseudomonas putida]|uniref:tyrosine-type recombinase/integrase n=1 Tax=Pseudomonas putida TaxID=303 RepID=UPI0002D4F3FA|nr:tyrosine-type recombinase/integrase [Pseudomonas putida]
MNQLEHIAAWYSTTVADEKLLFETEFVSGKTNGELTFTPEYIGRNDLGGSPEALEKYTRLLVIELEAKGILQFGELSSTACNWRIRVLGWYAGLSDEEKGRIRLHSNKITARYLDKNVPGFKGLIGGAGYLKGVRDALETINAEHMQAGFADPAYLTVKERSALSGQAPSRRDVDPLLELRERSLHSVAELAVSTPDIPYAPLLHLMAQASLSLTKFSKVKSYWTSFTYLRDMLDKQGFAADAGYSILLDPLLLANFRRFLGESVNSRVISPTYATSILSHVRLALKLARTVKGLSEFRFINVPGFAEERVTDTNRPYLPSERLLIAEAVEADIERYMRLSRPYEMSHVGEDPCKPDGTFKWGVNAIDNARWVFENVLNCQHDIRHRNISTKYEAFFLKAICQESSLGTRGVLESWGIIWKVDATVISPFMVRLAQVTGLNANSLKYLRVDDYVERHPLTLRPCLRYWKERSAGEMEYHLDIFHAEITWLTHAQSVEVKRIIDCVLHVTAEIRAKAPLEIQSHLFIWESSSGKTFGQVKSLESSRVDVVSNLFSEYSRAKALLGEDGSHLAITASRLRPSFVSELVEKGVSLREVQYILGHKFITTTIDYLDQLDYNRIAREKLNVEIEALHKRAVDQVDGATHDASSESSESSGSCGSPKPAEPARETDESNIIFRTPLADCRNIFNPPEHIRKSANYIPGRPCSLYNKCLSCDNSMITVLNLPHIFALGRDYRKALQISRIMDTPYGRVVVENLAIIDGIIGPNSEFSPEELAQAEAESDFIDSTIVVDSVGL